MLKDNYMSMCYNIKQQINKFMLEIIMGAKQSKSRAQIQEAATSPYAKIKQLIDLFERGPLREKNSVVTEPCSMEHVQRLAAGLVVAKGIIAKIDTLEEGVDKTDDLQALVKAFSDLRYHSLMRSDALNRSITSTKEDRFEPICNEAEFNAIRRALYPYLPNTLSGLPADIISGPLAGNADIVEANPGAAYDQNHGFSNRKNRDRIVETTRIFFKPLSEERTQRLLSKFLHCIAHGEQDKAEKLLKLSSEWLLIPGSFTDYSGRTFHCTAYEYAYWAKDTHMCRMLERYMSDETKADMAERINKMEGLVAATNKPVGLTYSQHGSDHQSAHFDMSALITALQNYVDGYDNWERTSNWDAIKAAWKQVGLAQRDVPVHVMNEYCRRDRSFVPVPPALKLEFDEASLPRVLTFYNYATGSNSTPVFPLDVSGIAGIGFEFSLFRARGAAWRPMAGGSEGCYSVPDCRVDLAAVSRLDEVRTADLTQSRENLGLIAQEPDHGLRPY
jgi:hypothetical protein